jgi:hypothetical protein
MMSGLIARCAHPDRPHAHREIVARFVTNGFTGAIKAWLADDPVSTQDPVGPAISCVPVWWT